MVEHGGDAVPKRKPSNCIPQTELAVGEQEMGARSSCHNRSIVNPMPDVRAQMAVGSRRSWLPSSRPEAFEFVLDRMAVMDYVHDHGWAIAVGRQ